MVVECVVHGVQDQCMMRVRMSELARAPHARFRCISIKSDGMSLVPRPINLLPGPRIQFRGHGLWVPFLWPKNLGQLFLACCLIDMQWVTLCWPIETPKWPQYKQCAYYLRVKRKEEKRTEVQPQRSAGASVGVSQALLVRYAVLPCN